MFSGKYICVYMSQLVRYARIYSKRDDFIYRHRRLSLKLQQQGYKILTTHEVVSQILQKSLRRVKEVWNNADGTTILDFKRSPCRVYMYPFELYFNLFLMCVWLCFYFLSLFNVLFVGRAFFYFCSRVLISLCCKFS